MTRAMRELPRPQPRPIASFTCTVSLNSAGFLRGHPPALAASRPLRCTSCAIRTCSASNVRAAAPARASREVHRDNADPPSPRHADCIAREKECDRARGQSARRGYTPGRWREHREIVTSARPTLPIARAAHVGPPKTRLWPTPARAFVARALPRALVL